MCGFLKICDIILFSLLRLLVLQKYKKWVRLCPPPVVLRSRTPISFYTFYLIITPEDGFWFGGVYKFHIDVPVDYNNVVSINYYIDMWNIT